MLAMLTRSTKIFLAVLLAVLLCFGLFATLDRVSGTSNPFETPTCSDSRKLPRRSMTIVIYVKQQEVLFMQLRKFGEKNGFSALKTAVVSPDGLGFSLLLERDDVDLNGANPFSSSEFLLDFYDVHCANPTPEATLDDLVKDLETFVREIPGATFTLQKDIK